MKIIEELVQYLESKGMLGFQQVQFLQESGYVASYVYDPDYDGDYYEYIEEPTDHEELFPELAATDTRRRKQGKLGHFTGTKQRHAQNYKKMLTANSGKIRNLG